MAKTIVLIGTLDTKGEELKYIKELIERRGHRTIAIDGGMMGEPFFPPEISREEVARTAGMSLEEIIALGGEGKAMEVMAQGASKIVQGLYTEGRLDGIVAVGGSMGTTLGTLAMKGLPRGCPSSWFRCPRFPTSSTPQG